MDKKRLAPLSRLAPGRVDTANEARSRGGGRACDILFRAYGCWSGMDRSRSRR